MGDSREWLEDKANLQARIKELKTENASKQEKITVLD
jgi:hypothetical protein